MARTGMAFSSSNYAAGDYYSGYGSNYAAGGLFSFVGKALKTVAGVASQMLPGPIGAIARIGTGILGGAGAGRAVQAQLPTFTPAGLGPMLPEPGIAGAVHRIVPGGKTGFGYYNKKGEFIEGKRPVMNPMNVRALRRASRRLDGFARTARKALKHSPFMLVSRASRGRRGSPGVISRSEAARALKR